MFQELSTIEEERAGRLNKRRLLDTASLQGAVSASAEGVAEKLERMIEKGDDKTALFIVLFIALLKDGVLDIGLDFVGGAGLIPILGQIPGVFLSAVLFYLMWGRGMLKGTIFAWVISLFVADNLWILEEFPLTTVAVLIAWHGLVKKIRKARADRERLMEVEEEELARLEESYQL